MTSSPSLIDPERPTRVLLAVADDEARSRYRQWLADALGAPLAVGEEERPTTRKGEDGPLTTLAHGEEGPVTTLAEGEEDELLDELEPVKCIPVRQIQETKIIDNQNILFYMNGNKIYRNNLPHKCGGLKRRDAFMYEVRTSRLCDLDTIKVVERFGGGFAPGASCGLGKFYPISEELAELLVSGELQDQPEDVTEVEDVTDSDTSE